MAKTIVQVGLPWLAAFDGAKAIRQALQAPRPLGPRQLRTHVWGAITTPLHHALAREPRPARSAVAVG
jgi:hypothetical protein